MAAIGDTGPSVGYVERGIPLGVGGVKMKLSKKEKALVSA